MDAAKTDANTTVTVSKFELGLHLLISMAQDDGADVVDLRKALIAAFLQLTPPPPSAADTLPS